LVFTGRLSPCKPEFAISEHVRQNLRAKSPVMNIQLQPFFSGKLIGWVQEVWAVRLFCLLFLSPAFPMLGQVETPVETPYYVQAWTAEDGLPENRVVGLGQTADGYLWVLTRGGLVRFDGVHFELFEAASSTGFITSTMWGLYLDRENRLWIAKEHGSLVCIGGTKVTALTAGDGLPQFEEEKSMGEDDAGNLWIAYNRGTVMRLANNRVEDFTSKNGLPAEGVCYFASDRSKRLWFAKNGQVGLLRGGKFVTLLNLVSHIIQVAPARTGGIWICAGQKVLKFNEGMEPVTLAQLPKTRATAEPTALLEDNEGAVWVGTPDGLFRCDSNSVNRVETSSPIITSLMEDREGGLWAGTAGGGLDHVQRRVVSLIGEAAGLPFTGVRSVCQDASGAIWTVGENWVLARQQDRQWIPVLFDKNISNTHATCVTADAKGRVWVGTDLSTLYRRTDGQFQKFDLGKDLHSGGLRSLFVTKSGDLWIAVDAFNTNSCLYRIRNGTVRNFELPSGYRYIRAMTEDAAGNIWAGASDGLLVRVTGNKLIDETAKYPR
jgi:ligand-binding sensor domain-containing protein